jgi:hypothetical protein
VKESLQIYSPLQPDECARRLLAAIDSERSALFSFSSLFGSRPVIGRVNSSSIRLRKRIGYRNSFQTFLTAAMRPHGTGTIIQGKFSMHTFTRVFMPIWFGGVALFGVAGLLLSIFTRSSAQSPNTWLFLLIAPGMLLFGFVLARFGRYLARDEARFLADFLRHTLDANEEAKLA